MKIYIIGCSGSGKTWLADRLAEKYNIPHYDLDDIQWDNSSDCYGIKNTPEKRSELLNKVLENEDWIMEGVYYAWTGQCFADADLIYVLDVPKRVYTFRIVKRFVLRKLGVVPGKKETLKSLRDLLQWTDKFQKVNMRDIRTILGQYGNKVRYLCTRGEINSIL